MQRGLAGAVFLLMTEFSTLRIRLQLAELSLMELIYCCLRWQDGVEVVAVPFHPALVKILAMVHRHKVLVEEGTDTVYHGVPAHPGDSGDGAVAGMAGMRPAILNQQQIGVYHECGGREIQQKNFVGEGEKILAIGREKIFSERASFCDEPRIDQGGEMRFHGAHRFVDAFRDHLRGKRVSAVVTAVAEVGQDHERNWFEPVLPHGVWDRETVMAGISPGPAEGDMMFPHWLTPPCVCCSTQWMNFSLGTTRRLPVFSTGKSASCINS